LPNGSNLPCPRERERAGERAVGIETSITILQSVEAGLALLDLVTGYDELIVVDAVQTGHAQPGYVHELEIDQMPLLPGGSPHFLGLAEMLALGRELHLPVPRKARVFAVEVEDPYTLEQGLTPALSAAFPGLVALLEERIRSSTPPLAPRPPVP
jgi:hydrogenase maturation protease